ncbi:IstB domain-containing protein ATP-binding protein [Rhodococcus wratislaviensis IFP 2016]|nr:IstB domain-containing protein ATP-binding protein [Rhodococcus wratislaviensis IFP 2016]
MTGPTPTSPAAARRRRGLTPEAAATAIEQACRDLRLPTVRTRFEDMLTVAHKEQLTYEGFLADLLRAECDDRARRRSIRRVKAAGFPARNGWRTSTSTPTPTSTRPPSTASPAASGSARANRCV